MSSSHAVSPPPSGADAPLPRRRRPPRPAARDAERRGHRHASDYRPRPRRPGRCRRHRGSRSTRARVARRGRRGPGRAKHGGREGADVDDIVLARPTDTELGAAARDLLAALGAGFSVPEHAGEPFGFKTSWLAIRGAGAEAVADAIGLAEREPASWREGLDRAGEGDVVFVTPEAGGWIFAVGVEWLEDLDAVERLSRELGTDVQYYATHRVPEAHVWARAVGGRLTRAAGYVGERGEAFGEGEPTDVERRLGVDWLLTRWSEAPELEEYPGEETVAEIAGAWSIDPTTLARVASSPWPGLIGRVLRPLG